MNYRPQNAGIELVIFVFKSIIKMIRKLFVLSLLIVTTAYAQKRDTTLFKAGTELIKYERAHTAGLGLQLAGSILVGIGASVESGNSSRQPLIIAGGVMSLIGFFVQLTSASHIKKAGILLRQNKIVIPL